MEQLLAEVVGMDQGRTKVKDYILFGAGTIGRLVARQLISKGTPPIAFADNDASKWGTRVEGIEVHSPEILSKFTTALWVATVLRTPFREEIENQMFKMGVQNESVANFFSRSFPPLDDRIVDELIHLSADDDTKDEIWNQRELRLHGDDHKQRPMIDIKDVYFPPFIEWKENETFLDCGAADGDTVVEIQSRFGLQRIVSFEPDERNYDAFQSRHFGPNVSVMRCAVSDFDGLAPFTSTGDQTAHFGSGNRVPVVRIDSLEMAPTFIKMDIEGAELNALWGARETIRKHSPVLAVCAYHMADHLWQIPLLIKAINPSYNLFLRRYLEGTWELIWYAVPPERTK